MPLEQYPDEELTLAPWLEAIVSARVRAAVLEEREACAAHVREVLKECLTPPLKHLGDVAAAAVRARGNS